MKFYEYIGHRSKMMGDSFSDDSYSNLNGDAELFGLEPGDVLPADVIEKIKIGDWTNNLMLRIVDFHHNIKSTNPFWQFANPVHIDVYKDTLVLLDGDDLVDRKTGEDYLVGLDQEFEEMKEAERMSAELDAQAEEEADRAEAEAMAEAEDRAAYDAEMDWEAEQKAQYYGGGGPGG